MINLTREEANQPEPVAWMEIQNYLDEENLWCERKVLSEYDNGRNIPLYTAPPQREELRRLHEVNAELVEALRTALDTGLNWRDQAFAAIAKATGEQQ